MNDILALLSLVTAAGFILRSCWAITGGNQLLCWATAFIALGLGESIASVHSIIPWIAIIMVVLIHGVHKALTMPDHPDKGHKSIAGVMIITLFIAFTVYNFNPYAADIVMLCGLFVYMATLATRDLVSSTKKGRIPIK